METPKQEVVPSAVSVKKPHQNQKQQHNWERVKLFTHETTLITAEVSRLPLPTPAYSMAIGRMVDGKLRQHFHVRRERSLVAVNLEADYVTVVGALMVQAQEFIVAEMKKDLETYLETRIERDQKNANRGKPVTKVTGKTERDRTKGK